MAFAGQGGLVSRGGSAVGSALQAAVESVSPAELAVSLVAPEKVQPGVEWDVLCTVTNRGAATLNSIGLQITRIPGLEVVSVSSGTLDTGCCSDNVANAVVAQLAPGEGGVVTVRLRAATAGVWPVNIQAFDDLNEPSVSGDEKFVYAQPVNGVPSVPNFVLPFPYVEWSSGRNQWVAWSGRSVLFLSPFTLEPQGAHRFPEIESGFKMEDDGIHAWAILQNGDVARLVVNTGEMDFRFPVPVSLTNGRGAIVLPLFFPNMVVVAGPDTNAQPTVIGYVNGVATGTVFTNGLAAAAGPVRMVASFNHVYLSLGNQLRELTFDDLGVQQTRNLDAFGGVGDSLAYSNEILFNGTATALDLATLKPVSTGVLADQFVFGIGFGATPTGPGTSEVRAYDTSRGGVIWRKSVAVENITNLVSGGYIGVLVRGTNGGLISSPPNSGADLALSVTPPDPNVPLGSVVTLPLHISRVAGEWSALNTRLVADFSNGISAVDPASSSNHWALPLGMLDSARDVNIQVRINEPGLQTLTLRLESDFTDPDPANSTVVVSWNIFVNHVELGEFNVADDGQPLKLRLSAPAAEDTDLNFHVELLTASLNDVTGTNFVVHFPKGAAVADLPVVAADTIVEAAEQFRLVWDSGPINPTQPYGVVTITNDDHVQLLTGNITTLEGDSGSHVISIPVVLADPIGVELHVDYSTTALTATAGLDFEATSGLLVFVPGQLTNYVNVRIFGDKDVEADETFGLNLTLPATVIAPAQPALVTIVNDDAIQNLLHLRVDDLSFKEGDAGTNRVTVPITLEGVSADRVEIGYILVSGTAVAGVDFVTAAGVLAFEPGEVTKNLSIELLADTVVEPDEHFSIQFLAPASVAVPLPTPVITILNDDTAVAVKPVVLRARIDDQGKPVFEFDSVTGENYTVQKRADLSTGEWTNEGAVRAGTGSPIVFGTTVAGVEGYWRVLAQ